MLVIAGWLVARSAPSPWQVGLLIVGYALLELCLLVLSVPILIGEVLLLASFIYWSPRSRESARPAAEPSRDLRGVGGVVRDEVAH